MENHKTKSSNPRRRQYKRAPTNLMLQYSDGRRLYSEFLCDFSLGGVRIEALKPLEPGTELTIILPSKPALKIRGEVKWVHKKGYKYQIGIQFIEPTLGQEFRLKEIMQSFFWESSLDPGDIY